MLEKRYSSIYGFKFTKYVILQNFFCLVFFCVDENDMELWQPEKSFQRL